MNLLRFILSMNEWHLMSLTKRAKKRPWWKCKRLNQTTKTVSTPDSDFSWTHGQWREAESSSKEVTDKEPQTLNG